MQEPLLHWYLIAEQVVSEKNNKDTALGLKDRRAYIHPYIHMTQGERIVEMHTLSTVDLISPIQAVCLSIAHKQGMQRTVATAFVSGPHCEEMHHSYQCVMDCPGQGQGARVITVSNFKISHPLFNGVT